MNTMHLIGAEEVSRAGHNMAAAASDMQRAAGASEYALQQHQQFMTDWLRQFEAVLSSALSTAETLADTKKGPAAP